MRLGKFVAFAVSATLPIVGAAQTRANLLDLVARGKLQQGLPLANQLAAQKGATSADFQIQGLLLAASGKIPQALDAFINGAKISKPQPSATGLEPLPYDSALYKKLDLIRGRFVVSDGQAAFLNNIGLCQIILGRTKSGFNNLEQATKLASGFSAPYLNQAVGHLLKNEGSRAVSTAKRAVNLGDSSVMAKSILADADLSVNRLSDAREELKMALQDQPDHPIALSVMAKFCEQTGDSRGAERYRSQALAGGAPIVVDGALRPSLTKGNVAGGAADEQHLLVNQKSFLPSGVAGNLNLADDKERVEDRSDAYQGLGQGSGEIGNALGALHVDYKNLGAGRPGPSTFEPGVISNPNASLAFHQANVFGDQFVGPVLLHARARTSQANVYDSGNTMLGHDADGQAGAELRYDFTKLGGKTTTGFAYSHLNRGLTNNLAIDPTEELLPAGNTNMWSYYALHQRNLNPFMLLSFGGQVGSTGKSFLAEPYVDLALHLGTKNLLHVGYSSMFNSDVSDLMPDQMRPPDVLQNPIDRIEYTATPYNQKPLLFNQQGRQQTLQANLRTSVNPNLRFNTTAYHHDLENFTIQGTDPQTAVFLNQNVMSAGHATGVSESVSWDVARKLGIKLDTYAQTTRMEPGAGLYNGTSPGSPVSLDLPYFPNLGLNLGLNFHDAAWSGSLVAETIGHRTVATGVPLGPAQYCCSYIQVQNPITAYNFFAHAQLPTGEAYIAIYNITKVSFYPGDPGRITVVVGVKL